MREWWRGHPRRVERHVRSPRPPSLPTGLRMVRWRWSAALAGKFVLNIRLGKFFTKPQVGSATHAFRQMDRRWRLSIIHLLGMMPDRLRSSIAADRKKR